MINWHIVQTRLGVASDGIAGRGTWTALLAKATRRAPDATLRSMANAAVVHLPRYGISETPARLANFLAQTMHESARYTRFEENLNYSAKRLVQVWPNRFPTLEAAAPYANNPEKLANKVYSGRMGNTEPGDGWKNIGRGILQTTGADNYEAADKRLGIGLDTNPELAAVPALSLLIAADFWDNGRVNVAIDGGNLTLARRIVNGGSNGLDEVLAEHNRLMLVLA